MLAIPQGNSEKNESTWNGPEPEEGEEESRMVLRFSTPRDPAAVCGTR